MPHSMPKTTIDRARRPYQESGQAAAPPTPTAHTGDGLPRTRPKGHLGFNEFIGPADDLDRNLCSIAQVAGLTVKETQWLTSRVHKM